MNWRAGACATLDGLEFPGSQAGRQIAAHLCISYVSHATAEGIANNGPFVHDGFALEVLVAGEGHRLPDTLLRVVSCVGCCDRSRAARTTASAWLPYSAAIFRCAAITSPSE